MTFIQDIETGDFWNVDYIKKLVVKELLGDFIICAETADEDNFPVAWEESQFTTEDAACKALLRLTRWIMGDVNYYDDAPTGEQKEIGSIPSELII